MEKTLWQTSSPHPLMWSKNEINTQDNEPCLATGFSICIFLWEGSNHISLCLEVSVEFFPLAVLDKVVPVSPPCWQPWWSINKGPSCFGRNRVSMLEISKQGRHQYSLGNIFTCGAISYMECPSICGIQKWFWVYSHYTAFVSQVPILKYVLFSSPQDEMRYLMLPDLFIEVTKRQCWSMLSAHLNCCLAYTAFYMVS